MGSTADAMARAARLTREGRLMEATRTIQRALGWGAAPAAGAARTEAERQVEPAPERDVVDVPFREVAANAPRIEGHVEAPREPPPRARRPRAASFTAHFFAFGGHRWRYRLFEPERADAAVPLPVIVMLHGCKQDSEDFARGTRMNEVAAREGFLVLYPEQLRKNNQMGCWNWFEPQHQRREGEPAMIAALVQEVVAAHGGDASRVYVAGLSAGGAMAALLGELYPEVFAAVGVHSGLPPRAARDVPSAFTAMRKGSPFGSRPAARPLPTIVFHGSADKTVTESNGDAIVQRQLGAYRGAGVELLREEGQHAERAARSATRVRWLDASGKPQLESWRVAAAPHAWSGGSDGGTFTDPQGPDASSAMAEFFLQHLR